MGFQPFLCWFAQNYLTNWFFKLFERLPHFEIVDPLGKNIFEVN